jgi:hypothetical protein
MGRLNRRPAPTVYTLASAVPLIATPLCAAPRTTRSATTGCEHLQQNLLTRSHRQRSRAVSAEP